MKYAESLAERMAIESAALTGTQVNIPGNEPKEPEKTPEKDALDVAYSEYPILAEHGIKNIKDVVRYGLSDAADEETLQALLDAWGEHSVRMTNAEVLILD